MYCLSPHPSHVLPRETARRAQRILFGADSPWGDQQAVLTAVRALPLTDEERRLILHDNALRLLGPDS